MPHVDSLGGVPGKDQIPFIGMDKFFDLLVGIPVLLRGLLGEPVDTPAGICPAGMLVLKHRLKDRLR
jgi:hypothetical protein